MPPPARNLFHVTPQYQPLMREVGLDAEAVFDHPDIRVWRSVTERDNATLDAHRPDGTRLRLHVKRFHATRAATTPAEAEVAGIRALLDHAIPTAPLVGWGRVADGRSFVLTEDLAGYAPSDKLIERGGATFDQLRDATADLAAKLHAAHLHHRDLYLCHFFAKVGDGAIDLRLIDAARVRRLPRWPFRTRWVVKDLAQFWYSATKVGASDAQRLAWLARYAEKSGDANLARLRPKVERKANWIARHDAKLRRTQPGRDVSLPTDADTPHAP